MVVILTNLAAQAPGFSHVGECQNNAKSLMPLSYGSFCFTNKTASSLEAVLFYQNARENLGTSFRGVCPVGSSCWMLVGLGGVPVASILVFDSLM